MKQHFSLMVIFDVPEMIRDEFTQNLDAFIKTKNNPSLINGILHTIQVDTDEKSKLLMKVIEQAAIQHFENIKYKQ